MADETKKSETTTASKRATRRNVRARNKATIKPERVAANKREDVLAARQKRQLSSDGDSIAKAAAGVDTQRRVKVGKRMAFKVLYFIQGSAPSEDDLNAAMDIGPNVQFRNAGKIVPGAPLENCDAVAGPAVPLDYAETYPKAGKGMQVASDGSDKPDTIVNRPNRALDAQGGPRVRVGTVDDGLAHASGTGSAKPGLQNADPLQSPGRPVSEQRAAEQEWKTNKSGGASG